MEPSIRMTLLDSLGKRITFLQEVCNELGLQNVQCVHARAEEFAAEHRQSFDFAVSRAVANLSVLCELCLPLVKAGGYFLSGGADGRLPDPRHRGGPSGDFYKKNCRNTKKISQTICKNQKESVIIRILAFESEVGS